MAGIGEAETSALLRDFFASAPGVKRASLEPPFRELLGPRAPPGGSAPTLRSPGVFLQE